MVGWWVSALLGVWKDCGTLWVLKLRREDVCEIIDRIGELTLWRIRGRRVSRSRYWGQMLCTCSLEPGQGAGEQEAESFSALFWVGKDGYNGPKLNPTTDGSESWYADVCNDQLSKDAVEV